MKKTDLQVLSHAITSRYKQRERLQHEMNNLTNEIEILEDSFEILDGRKPFKKELVGQGFVIPRNATITSVHSSTGKESGHGSVVVEVNGKQKPKLSAFQRFMHKNHLSIRDAAKQWRKRKR